VRLQDDVEPPDIAGLVDRPGAGEAIDRSDGRILQKQIGLPPLPLNNADGGGVGRRLVYRDDDAGILLRQKTLGNDRIKDDRREEGQSRDRQGRVAVLQHPAQAASVMRGHKREAPLPAMTRSSRHLRRLRLQQVGAHHRGQRQGNDRRDGDRDTQRDRELAKQAPDDAAHEQQRNEHGDQ